jgi:mortality factor 4-like protein 1
MASEPTEALFTDGDRVLCFHGPLIYEGKVLKQEWRDKDQKWFCFIHYAGWNKSWDEFVPEDRVLAYTDENLKIQKEHKKSHEDAIKAAKRSAIGMAPRTTPSTKKKGSLAGESTGSSGKSDSRGSTPVMDSAGVPGRKSGSARRNELDDEAAAKKKKREDVQPEQLYMMTQTVEIPIPDPVKAFLLDDWDRVSRQKTLLKVPAFPTVDGILDAYLVSLSEADSIQSEFCAGLKEYFNTLLGSQLLYQSEKQQLSKVNGDYKETDYSAIYGLPHLMRLLTKIGPCLAYTTIPTEGVELLQSLAEQFLIFVMKNYNLYFEPSGYLNIEIAEGASMG